MAVKQPFGEWSYVDGFKGRTFVPDVRVYEDCEAYVYRPMRGYSAILAVENREGDISGWMLVDDAPGGPYANVRDWMDRNRYLPAEID